MFQNVIKKIPDPTDSIEFIIVLRRKLLAICYTPEKESIRQRVSTNFMCEIIVLVDNTTSDDALTF